MLIDSHCHLDYPALAKEQQAVVARARAAGVVRMLTISTHLSKAAQVKAVAETYDDVYCTVGTHPHHAGEDEEAATVEDILRAADHPKVVGIGETGLDYFYDKSPRAVQQEGFCAHIRACLATDMPIIIHSRDAEEDTIRMIREETQGREGALRGVLHCFSSGRILAEQGLELGLYISLSGILTFKKSEELRAIARDVPLDRLLVETDAPFLAPEPYRGKICEPSYVVQTAKVLAEVKGVSMQEIEQRTTENFYRLFDRVKRAG